MPSNSFHTSCFHRTLLLTCFAIYIGYLFIGFDGISSKIYLGNGSVSQFSLFIPSGLLARATDILLLAKGVCISVKTPSQLLIFWSFHLRPKKVRKVTSVYRYYQAPSQFFDLLNFSLPGQRCAKHFMGREQDHPVCSRSSGEVFHTQVIDNSYSCIWLFFNKYKVGKHRGNLLKIRVRQNQ